MALELLISLGSPHMGHGEALGDSEEEAAQETHPTELHPTPTPDACLQPDSDPTWKGSVFWLSSWQLAWPGEL